MIFVPDTVNISSFTVPPFVSCGGMALNMREASYQRNHSHRDLNPCPMAYKADALPLD